MSVLVVATCQFPVGHDTDRNLSWVKRQMSRSAQRGARVAHFPEGALSGYAGTDFPTFGGFDWERLHRATEELREHARTLGIWTVVGSAHRFSDIRRPHNSLYVISDSGEFEARYDKRFCAGGSDEQSGDLAHYSPGGHSSTWSIDGVLCGALICHDYRYPELYREYSSIGVELVFH